MKRFVFAFFFACEALNCAPVGSTACPKILQEGLFIPSDSWANIRLGYEGDFVGDAKMKQFHEGSGRVDTDTQSTNSGTATLNLLDRLDLYAVFGSSRTCAQWRFTDAEDVVYSAEIETFQDFLWAVGGRAILYEWGQATIGVGGRYSAADNRPSWLTIDGVNANVAGTHLNWRQWQLNADISYRIDILTPYIGFKYSQARTRIGTFSTPIAANGSGENQFRNRVPTGLFLGCTFSTGKYFMLNIEGRLIDEEALTVSGDLRF